MELSSENMGYTPFVLLAIFQQAIRGMYGVAKAE